MMISKASNRAGRVLGAAAGALLVVLPLTGCGGDKTPDVDPRPDLVLITIDTLRADHVGPWREWLAGPDGPVVVDTPAIDAFAANSIVFRDAFSAVPITTASLGGMLTGRLPRNHGALNNSGDLNPDVPTMTMALKDAGYETAAFLPSFLADKPGFKRGFDTYVFSPLGQEPWRGDEVVARTLKFLKERDASDRTARPLFLWVHLLDPHAPYDPGPELEAKYLAGLDHPAEIPERLRDEVFLEASAPSQAEAEVIRALYRGDVEYTDRALAPLLKRLKHTPPGAREIYTLFTSDHGEMLATHHGYVGHTGWLFEDMLHVPLLIHDSSGKGAGEVWEYPSFGPDVAPTLLALANDPALDAEVARILATGDGSVPLLDPEVRVYIERLKSEGKESEIKDRLLVSESFAPEGFFDQRMARLGSEKLVLATAPERPGGLFELSSDPLERNDLSGQTADESPELAARFELLKKLAASWAETHGAVGTAVPFDVELSEEQRDALGSLGYGEGH